MIKIRKIMVILVLLAVVLVACGGTPADRITNEDGFTYYKTTFEGMDCIILDGYESLGITCNWEQYDG